MKIEFPIIQKHQTMLNQTMLIRIPKAWEERTTDMIENCLRECGKRLDENASVVYLVRTPEPWTKDELDYLRKIAERKQIEK